MTTYRRGDVVRVTMPRSTRNEIRKDRPWVVLTPDSYNESEFVVIVAPLSTGRHPYPYRVPCTFGGKANHIVLDQMTAVTYRRVRQKIGAVSPQALRDVLGTLREMFEE